MKRLLLFISLFLLPFAASGAGYSLVSGRWSPDQYVPTTSVQEHYDLGYQALFRNDWDEALVNFMIIIYHFDDSSFYGDALFHTGICYYFKGDFDLANRQFDRYLTSSGKLKHFEKVFDFKYQIADYYHKGRKKHLFGFSRMPKWASGREDALTLLDEIIAALPAKDVAARALYKKADILRRRREFRESIDCLQTLARRFPKHSLAADSFVFVSEIYLQQSSLEAQNPDLLSLARVNINKFTKSFPGDERISVAESNFVAMQEVYAQSLYETGRFYERKKKPHASAIYYQDAVSKYPGTEAAQRCQNRLSRMPV